MRGRLLDTLSALPMVIIYVMGIIIPVTSSSIRIRK
jgi:hypothetical protein